MKELLKIFKKVPDNSIWEYNGYNVIIVSTSWIPYTLCPVVYYYNLPMMEHNYQLQSSLRIEFIMNAKRLY